MNLLPETSAGSAGFPVLLIKKLWLTPPVTCISTFCPKHKILPGASVDTPGFNPISSIIIGIVC